MLTYLNAHEPGSVRKSGINEYCLVAHDSFKISNGKWYWHSRGFGGHSAYDYLTKVRGMDFKEAIQALIGWQSSIPYADYRQSPSKQTLKAPLLLPPANKNNDAVYAYLQGRGIDRGIIRRCLDNGSLYEAAKTHHCVFVGFEGDTPKFACLRSTADNLKQDVRNSDKRYGFVLPPTQSGSRNLILLESPCDALAHASLYKMSGSEGDGYRLSLGGVSSLALFGFLERHKGIDSIVLCLDADKAGIEAMERIIKELLSDRRYSNIRITVSPPPIGKDYSDTVQAIRRKQLVISKPYRSQEADFSF